MRQILIHNHEWSFRHLRVKTESQAIVWIRSLFPKQDHEYAAVVALNAVVAPDWEEQKEGQKQVPALPARPMHIS